MELAAATSGRAVVVSGLAVVVSTATLYLAADVIFSSLATGTIVVVLVAVASSLTVLCPRCWSRSGKRAERRAPRRARPRAKPAAPDRGAGERPGTGRPGVGRRCCGPPDPARPGHAVRVGPRHARAGRARCWA